MVIRGQFGLITSTVNQGNAGSSAWPVKIDQTTPGTTNNVYVTTVKPDGTNTMPSLDAAARKGFFRHTDGTNVTPAGDASARPIYTELIDGATRDLGKVDIAGFDTELPAGTQLLGKVGIDQTTPGTTNNVYVTTLKPDGSNTMPSGDAAARPIYTDVIDRAARDLGGVDILAALPAGDNNIGNVDIASALPAGDNNIGNIDVASALPAGDNNIGNVDLASAIPAGSNIIGNVRIDQTTPGTTNNVYVTTVKPDGTNTAPSMDAAARRGYVTHTDGTNSMPTGDAVARRIYHQHTDGTNSTPAMDVAARRGYQQITDGTDSLDITKTGDNVTNGVNIYYGYTSDPAGVSSGKSQPMECNRNGILVTFDGEGHYMAEGNAYACSTPSVTCTTETSVFGMAAQTTRLPIVTYMCFASDAPCLVQVYLKPTGAFSGTAITPTNRHTFVADASNALVKHTCTFATTRGVLVWSKWIDANYPAELPKAFYCTGYNSNVLCVSGTATGVVASCNLRVSCWWYEVKV